MTTSANGELRDFETGTGFAGAKLSEILPSARVARFVRMQRRLASLAAESADELEMLMCNQIG